jgi:hypothetical protein
MHGISLARGFASLHLAKLFCIALFLATPFSVTASCDKDPECDDVSAWAAFTRITLRQSISGSPEAIEWVGLFDHKSHDASIHIITHGSKEPMAGTVALVGGQVMLTKGLKLQPGYEIDALDAPVLSMRLVMILLKRLFPKGPDEIAGPTDIDRTDQVGIKYATPSASGYIPAPWHLKGKVSKLPAGRLPFDLVLSFPVERQDKQKSSLTIIMKGELAVLGRPVFRDADSLDGWTTYGLGPQQTQQGRSTILDYGARPQEATTYRTIGDVRAFIAAENHPGVRDTTKDFTGFWKKKCEEPFGLQIKHYGEEGKYSIVFCGPGGCGDPSQRRLTFITGDKRYEVVTEAELIQIGRSGDRETYHRCTKDTNPVLKYR